MLSQGIDRTASRIQSMLKINSAQVRLEASLKHTDEQFEQEFWSSEWEWQERGAREVLRMSHGSDFRKHVSGDPDKRVGIPRIQKFEKLKDGYVMLHFKPNWLGKQISPFKVHASNIGAKIGVMNRAR